MNMCIISIFWGTFNVAALSIARYVREVWKPRLHCPTLLSRYEYVLQSHEIINMTSKELVAFLRGEIDSTALPAEIELDKSLWQSMDDLWQRSVQHVVQGKVTEWGGTLLDAEDKLQLVNVRPGTSGTWLSRATRY